MYGYDFDGVVSIGIKPRNVKDVIITGRCRDETHRVLPFLEENGIHNKVYFNNITLEQRGTHTVEARTLSAEHKVKIIRELGVTRFFDDDELQIEIIQRHHPGIEIIHVKSNLVEK